MKNLDCSTFMLTCAPFDLQRSRKEFEGSLWIDWEINKQRNMPECFRLQNDDSISRAVETHHLLWSLRRLFNEHICNSGCTRQRWKEQLLADNIHRQTVWTRSSPASIPAKPDLWQLTPRLLRYTHTCQQNKFNDKKKLFNVKYLSSQVPYWPLTACWIHPCPKNIIRN